MLPVDQSVVEAECEIRAGLGQNRVGIVDDHGSPFDGTDAEDRDLEFTSQGREAGELVFVLGDDGRFRAKQ